MRLPFALPRQARFHKAMLTALDTTTGARIVLPDLPDPKALRSPTANGQLVCPVCGAALWLRAGEVRIPHFAHRTLADCHAGHASADVLRARLRIYEFFKERIASGKLVATITLEPVTPEAPKGFGVDIMLERSGKPSVAVVLLEKRLAPELRQEYATRLGSPSLFFRPVFLADSLRPIEGHESEFNLDTTQRELRLESPYDLPTPSSQGSPGTLHFIDPGRGEWTSLRRLRLVHSPQEFRASKVLRSPLSELLWSDKHSEWCHAGEAEALRQSRSSAPRQAPAPSNMPRSNPTAQGAGDGDDSHAPIVAASWIFRCVGCNAVGSDWQAAATGDGICVCRSCFAKGVRLPGGTW